MTSGSGTPAADALEARFRRVAAVEGALGMLSWDRMVMMPPGGGEARAEQAATLGVIAHELLTDPEMAGPLETAEGIGRAAWRGRGCPAVAVTVDAVSVKKKIST